MANENHRKLLLFRCFFNWTIHKYLPKQYDCCFLLLAVSVSVIERSIDRSTYPLSLCSCVCVCVCVIDHRFRCQKSSTHFKCVTFEAEQNQWINSHMWINAKTRGFYAAHHLTFKLVSNALARAHHNTTKLMDTQKKKDDAKRNKIHWSLNIHQITAASHENNQ